MTDQTAERIRGLLNSNDKSAQLHAWRDKQRKSQATATSPDDIARVQESLEQQNELLRAILASSVDTQEDARATAQNSRTFAWAGTAIALLTLVATVIAVVAAVRVN